VVDAVRLPKFVRRVILLFAEQRPVLPHQQRHAEAKGRLTMNEMDNSKVFVLFVNYFCCLEIWGSAFHLQFFCRLKATNASLRVRRRNERLPNLSPEAYSRLHETQFSCRAALCDDKR
jgi:hypothetical protein